MLFFPSKASSISHTKQFYLDVISGSKEVKGNFLKQYSLCFSLATKHVEKADKSSYLIAIIVSVLPAFVILGTCSCVALLLFLV